LTGVTVWGFRVLGAREACECAALLFSVQVKYSKDYAVTHIGAAFGHRIRALGWWTLNREKIKKSKADLWVFVMQSFEQKTIECIVVRPRELLRRLDRISGRKERIQSYFWVTDKKKCWETRGLGKAEKILIANNTYSNEIRDFSGELNDWKPLKRRLMVK